MNYQLLEKMGIVNLDLSYVLIVLLAAVIIGWVIAIIALVKYSSLTKKYEKFMGGNSAKALESHIMDLVALNKENRENIELNRKDIEKLFDKQQYNFQKMGILKYDAFREMGGNLSFSLALLTDKNDGFLINAVHNIDSTYCYAKKIIDGKSSINLSEEEAIALERAINNEDARLDNADIIN